MFINPQQDLPRTSPEQQGISSSAILQFVQAAESRIHELHSFMLLRHGSVIAEGWWHPYRAEHPHLLFSVSKSFTSTAVGLAVTEGYFAIDDPVLSFFPDETPLEASEFWSAMTVHHLLSMSTGHEVDTWAYMDGRPDGNWTKGFFEVPLLHIPGTHFLYNTGATYMLAAIVQKATGMKLLDYLQPRLFEPLGIANATWRESPQGIAMGGIGLSIKTEDLARFGQLYLQKGLWQDRRILPQEWVEAATSNRITLGENGETDWSQGYGYQFWRCRHDAYRADGVFGQYCIIMPQQDAVLAITGGIDVFDAQEPLDLLWDTLLPAMGADPLPEDAASQDALMNKLSSLSLPLAQGKPTSPLAAQISGRTYQFDANNANIETVRLNFTESGCRIRVKTTSGEEAIACGYGLWEQSHTTLFNAPWLAGATPIVASGAWTTEETFRVIVRLYETPFFHTLVFHFDGDEMLIETSVNVSLEANETLLLTAHAI